MIVLNFFRADYLISCAVDSVPSYHSSLFLFMYFLNYLQNKLSYRLDWWRIIFHRYPQPALSPPSILIDYGWHLLRFSLKFVIFSIYILSLVFDVPTLVSGLTYFDMEKISAAPYSWSWKVFSSLIDLSVLLAIGVTDENIHSARILDISCYWPKNIFFLSSSLK